MLPLCILQIFYVRYFHNLNLFYGNVSFLYFLKISENQTASNVFKEYRKGSLGRNGLIEEFVGTKAKGRYQGVRNVHFSEILACFVFLLPPFWDSPFCLITDEFGSDEVVFPGKLTSKYCQSFCMIISFQNCSLPVKQTNHSFYVVKMVFS